MEERLRFILSLVNDWLKFAEAKNGVLLAVDLGILVALSGSISSSLLPKVTMLFAIVLVFLAVVAVLVSFIPQTRLRNSIRAPATLQQGSSLLFFAHIAEYEPDSYMKALYSQIHQDTTVVSSLELDYSGQIITNSRIALFKYRCFNIGLWLTVSAIASLVAGCIFKLLSL